MKKILNLLAFASLCTIIALAILYFTNNLELLLWVKYLFLLCSLIILVTVYITFGGRTDFDECLYCLKKAEKGLQKINFKKDKKLLNLKFLKIRNYLSFSERYMGNLYSDYDLHQIKSYTKEINEIKEKITVINTSQITQDRADYIITLQQAIKVVEEANNKRIDAIKQKKLQKKQAKSK